MFDNIPPDLKAVAPGAAGALLALLFLRKPPLAMLGTFIGGCMLAYYGTEWVASVVGMQRATGLVGFLIGSFGMALVAKFYDTLDAIEPKRIVQAGIDFIRKRLGLDEDHK